MTLKSGEILPHNASFGSLFAQLEAYPVFFAPNRKTILNGRYIKSVQLTHITMCDGHTFQLSAPVSVMQKMPCRIRAITTPQQ